MKIGFIGLGNVGSKLAGSLLRNGFALTVHDIQPHAATALLANGAIWAATPRQAATGADVVITCLPAPAASAAVMEDADNGVLCGLATGTVWMEMSTTDEAEVRRLNNKVIDAGGQTLDCPVSGGCHRADTGNIAIFVGGERHAFEHVLPALKAMGQHILHTGGLGSASVLKVVTNYLASANLVSLCEALVTSQLAQINLSVAYEAIRISSGNSFVHETESQVILNGSRDINFTMDLVVKDLSLFQAIAERVNAPLELSPLLLAIFKDGVTRYGTREWSPNIIRRLEDTCDVSVRAPNFPAQIIDDQPEVAGTEIIPQNAS